MATAGRIICAGCGANNFETQAACWKCGLAMNRAAVPVPPLASAAPGGASAPVAPAAYRPVSTVNPSLAIIWGVVLAIFFPYVAVPVGLVFMMLDDRRKMEVGTWTLIAGIVSSVIQFFLMAAIVGNMMSAGMGMVAKQAQRLNPSLNQRVGDEGLEGIPGVPGVGNGARPGGGTYNPPTYTPTEPDVAFPAPLGR